jgi:hypothetical protein
MSAVSAVPLLVGVVVGQHVRDEVVGHCTRPCPSSVGVLVLSRKRKLRVTGEKVCEGCW